MIKRKILNSNDLKWGKKYNGEGENQRKVFHQNYSNLNEKKNLELLYIYLHKEMNVH